MSDNSTKSKKSKRVYLFVLLTGVLCLSLLCVYPQNAAKQCTTKVDVQMRSVDNQPLVKEIVVKEIKKQLSAEALTQTITSISSKMKLESSLFASDVSVIRERLMGGALNVEALPTSTDSGDIGFSISIQGEGTNDEKEFVHLMANSIGKSLSPSSKSELILAQVKQIQTRLQETASLNAESRNSVEACFKSYADNQRRLFTKASRVAESQATSPSQWELKNLTEQRRKAYQEFQSNQTREFAGKREVQDSLLRRIEYLDQEIERLRKKSVGSERLADKSSVEQATFLDTQTNAVQPFEVDKELEKLKTDLALVVNKLDLAKSNFLESQKAANKLTDLVNQDLASVSVSLPTRTESNGSSSTHLWLILAISGVVSAMIVMRIDQRAFGNYFYDAESVEKTLQMPVIGSVEIPSENPNSNRELRILSKWVNGTIRSCEVLLAVAFVAFFAILLTSSDFSFDWLNDPVGLLRNSFK